MEKDLMKVGLTEKFGFLGFSASTNIIFNFKNLYYLAFLTMVLNINVGIAGTMLAIGTIWDAVNDPLIALFCANHTFKNGEKIRPYALWACVPWAITIVLLFVNFKVTESWAVVIGLVVYFLFEALYTFLCMPYNSLASLATKNDRERQSINAYRSLGGCLGSGIGAVAVVPLVKLFGGLKESDIIGPSDSTALLLTAILMGILCIAGSLFHYFTSRERIKPELDDKEEKIGLIKAYKMLFKCKSWVLNMVFIIGYAIIQAFVMNNVNYYTAYILGDSNLTTPILAAYLVSAVITSIIVPTIDSKLGRTRTTVGSIAITVLGAIPFIISPSTSIFMYINAFTFGIGLTATFVIFNTNRNNIADILEVQNGMRIDTLVAGGDNLITKLAEAAAIEVIAIAYGITGMNVDLGTNQTVATNNMITALLGWLPAVVALLMIFVAFKINIPKELAEAKRKREEQKSLSEN